MKILSLIFTLSILSFVTCNLAHASEATQKLLSTEVITTTLHQVSEVLSENYVYPDVAKEMQSFLHKQASAGHYNNSSTQRELITKIQADLRRLSKDGHISLLLSKDSVDRDSIVLPPRTKLQNRIRTEIISSSGRGEKIGYLEINTFSGAPDTKGRIIAAMERVIDSDSLIIDLRKNRGGSPNIVSLLSSYFIDSDIQLWSIVDRNGNQTFEARSAVNQNKFTGDVCILTSNKTYSAAEAFAYTLKHLGRASIIGEATGGGAHLVEMMRVNDDVDIRIPVARPYNQITGANWEGIGVIPTFQISASEAKAAAIEFLSGGIGK